MPSTGRCDPGGGYKRPERQLAFSMRPLLFRRHNPFGALARRRSSTFRRKMRPRSGLEHLAWFADIKPYRIVFSARRSHSGFAGFSF